MQVQRGTYTGYSIGCAVVWAVILWVLGALGKKETSRTILPMFASWWVGWTSATIARYVYPPPMSRTGVDTRPRTP